MRVEEKKGLQRAESRRAVVLAGGMKVPSASQNRSAALSAAAHAGKPIAGTQVVNL